MNTTARELKEYVKKYINKNPDGVFYIKNTTDEWHDCITGYFYTLDEAMKALEECSDWYRDKGTGTIYFQEFGLGKRPEKLYEA